MTTQTVLAPSVSVNTDERGITPTSIFTSIFTIVSNLDRVGMGLLRVGLVIIPLWIGGLKFVNYEADSIVPFVANSPLTSFLYHHPEPEYKHYMNKEGELKPTNREWLAQEGGRSEQMVRRAPADDLHTKNVPVEFCRRFRICSA